MCMQLELIIAGCIFYMKKKEHERIKTLCFWQDIVDHRYAVDEKMCYFCEQQFNQNHVFFLLLLFV